MSEPIPADAKSESGFGRYGLIKSRAVIRAPKETVPSRPTVVIIPAIVRHNLIFEEKYSALMGSAQQTPRAAAVTSCRDNRTRALSVSVMNCLSIKILPIQFDRTIPINDRTTSRVANNRCRDVANKPKDRPHAAIEYDVRNTANCSGIMMAGANCAGGE